MVKKAGSVRYTAGSYVMKYPPSGIGDSTCFYSEAWFESGVKYEVYSRSENNLTSWV